MSSTTNQYLRALILDIDCYTILVQGEDVVFGVQLLEFLGSCLMDYKSLTMEFYSKGSQIILSDDHNTFSVIKL